MASNFGREGHKYRSTFTDRRYYPGHPDPDQIVVEDIAHHLSMLCRFGGSCTEFYSVAQHSVIVSQVLPLEYAEEGLLHDATEAYIVDLPRPIKKFPGMEKYTELEDELALVIAKKFGLPIKPSPPVKDADNNVLVTEMKQLLPGDHYKDLLGWGYQILDLRIEPLLPNEAKKLFLARYNELFG